MKTLMIFLAMFFILMSCDSKATTSHPIISDATRQAQSNSPKNNHIKNKKRILGYDSIVIIVGWKREIWSKVFLSHDKATKSYTITDRLKYFDEHIIYNEVKTEQLSADWKKYYIDAVNALYIKESIPRILRKAPTDLIVTAYSPDLTVTLYKDGNARCISINMGWVIDGYEVIRSYELNELYECVYNGCDVISDIRFC